MKIKLDENMPVRLVQVLTELGHDVDTVPQEGLAGADDGQVWEATQSSDRFLITQDLDFSDTRRFKPGSHCGILIVRLREPGRDALVRQVRQAFSTENVDAWAGCFVVLTEHKLRVVPARKA